MTPLPPELEHALQHQRLLIVWGDVPFELPARVTGERTVLIKRLIAEAAHLLPSAIRLSVTPPLPIVSFDPTDRIEREFKASGRALRVVKSAQDSATPTRHTLIKLAGDLNSRTGLVLSREEVQHLLDDEDKRYLLDLVRSITEHDSAIMLVGCDPINEDFKLWWSIIRLLFGSAPIFAAGDPSSAWLDDVTYLGSVQDVVNVAFANLKAPPPKMDTAVSLSVQAEAALEETGPEITRPASENTQAVQPVNVQTLRVDAAVPEQVFVGRTFDLAVAIKQLASPRLAAQDLTHVESGEVQVVAEQNIPWVNLRVEVDAPDCTIEGKRSILFRLIRGQDSPLFYFRLKPNRAGALSLVVTVYQEDYWLGSARVNTVAADHTPPPAGQVSITVASQVLWLDCEVRLHNRSAAGYKVEMTLNGEQIIEGVMSDEATSFTPSGDPRDDGQRLFNLLLADPNLREAWGEARGQSKQRRIRLRIDARELRGLPWELLRDDVDILAAQADTPFSRYLPTEKPWGGAIAARPIRILAIISNPSDLADKYGLSPANVSTETSLLHAAVGSAAHLDFLSVPITLARLEGELQQGYHILHFIGHGAFNEKKQQAALYLQNDDGTTTRVLDDDFAGMLKRLAAPPQLIVLAACQSAQQAQTQAFSGLGPKLVQIGIPAVVAMQDNVTMLTARQFGAKFYRRLLEHGTVDRAMNEARSTLITNGRYDAAVPVLFMRLKDGRLWGEAAATAPVTPAQIGKQINVAGNYIDQSTRGDTYHIKIDKVETLNLGGGAKQATRAQPASNEADDAERASLQRQLKSARENLRLIEERKAEYVLGVDVPLQLIKEEQRLKDRVAELERKLKAVE